jgi:hypothetical protein
MGRGARRHLDGADRGIGGVDALAPSALADLVGPVRSIPVAELARRTPRVRVPP